MKVVFVRDVPNVGLEGDVKEVKKGHARNYLFPKGYAVLATAEELKRVESRKRAAAKRREEQAAELQGVAGTLDGISLVFAKKVTSKGNIYGSVSSTAIQQELKKLGHIIEKSMIKLEEPIRQLGDHQVEVDFGKEAIAQIKVTVEPAEGDKVEEGAAEEPEVVAEEQPEEEAEEAIAEEPEAVAEEQPEEEAEEAVAEEPEAVAEEQPEEEAEEAVAEEPEAVAEDQSAE
ncbi:MAG: 50S ribosomal protein L9, partial [bacterium]|nr:50S ribosomal protein L9 [bacterium]